MRPPPAPPGARPRPGPALTVDPRRCPVPHVVLLGDSIFDNAAYVAGGPAVVDQLHTILPADWKATLLAVDGDTTGLVADRLRGLPADASHLVVSVGGNDALRHTYLLQADRNVLPDIA